MTTTLGQGRFRYEVAGDWGKLPDGWELKDVAAIAVDKQDRVYVFNRGAHPMVVFDREGKFLRSWGEGVFTRAHGVHIGPDENLYCTDDGDHTVRKCTLEGKILLTIGIPGKPAPYMSGEPFHRCTHTALSPRGDIYVSDGYGNARVHKYSPDGKLLLTWGEPGCDPGQFNIPHNICADMDGWVYRYSTAMASTKHSGTTCTAPAGCVRRPGVIRSSMSESWGRPCPSIATSRTSGRASAS
jgi:streptogramin lyase